MFAVLYELLLSQSCLNFIDSKFLSQSILLVSKKWSVLKVLFNLLYLNCFINLEFKSNQLEVKEEVMTFPDAILRGKLCDRSLRFRWGV